MLTAIQTQLRGLVRPSWAGDVQEWGERVALYRQYAAGDHRARLTEAMRTMLRVTDNKLDRFNANYCGLITQAMSDRLVVTSIQGETPEATEWARGIQDVNRFDTLQMDVHESVLIDGDSFVMAAWSEALMQIVWAHEPAYDGDVGMIPVYDRMRRKLVAAVKVWWEGNTKLVNFYMPEKVEKYVWQGTPETPDPRLIVRDDAADWTDTKGAALGVPVVHFKNRATTYAWHGESELVNAIPLQDVLNRTITSMVMTSELSAFQIRVARGFEPPSQTQPGMWLVIGKNGLEKDQVADVAVMEQAQLVPFISEAEFTIDQIGSVTQTPILSSMGGSSSSGEALKQREVGLIGKVKRAQTRYGNSWEDAMKLSARLWDAYGVGKAPSSPIWRTQWQDASPRNDDSIVKNAMLLRDVVGDEEVLRMVAPVYGWDENKITSILAEKDTAAAGKMNQMGLPGFGMFGAGTDLNNPTPTLPMNGEGANQTAPMMDMMSQDMNLATA